MRRKKDIYEDFSHMLVGFIVMLVIIATCIAFSFKVSKYGYQLEIKDYFAYAGSFGGAILGAGISIFVLFITIDRSKYDQEENKLNSARPVIKVETYNIKYDMNFKSFIALKKDRGSTVLLDIRMKNIGTGPARDIKMSFDGVDVTANNGIIEKIDLGAGEDIYISINTSYEDVLIIDGEIPLKIICRDIFNKRNYEYTLVVINKAHKPIVQMIEENIIDIQN